MRTFWFIGLGVLLCGVAFAQDALAQDLSWSPDATEACLSERAGSLERDECIGRSTTRCIEMPNGYTTVGMSFCTGEEVDYWDKRLNAAYQALFALESALDAETAKWSSFAPPMASALRDMQRAWITYRDASCDYEASQWGGGSGTGPAVLHCRMQLTGTQALSLETRLADKTP